MSATSCILCDGESFRVVEPAVRELVIHPTIMGLADRVLQPHCARYQLNFSGIMHLMPGAAATERAAQQLASHGHAKPLVFAKRHQGAIQTIALRHHHHAGSGGGVPVFVDQCAGFNLFALVVGHPHLALCHPAGGEVQHKRLTLGVAQSHGDADATGVGAKTAITTMPCGHDRS